MTALVAIAFPFCCLLAIRIALHSMRNEWGAALNVVGQARGTARVVRVRRIDAAISRDRAAATRWAAPALGC